MWGKAPSSARNWHSRRYPASPEVALQTTTRTGYRRDEDTFPPMVAPLSSPGRRPSGRLDGIGRIDYFADIVRVIEQRDQVRPVALPALTDGRIFRVPGDTESSQFLLGLIDAQ